MTAFLGTFDPNKETLLRKQYRRHNAFVRAIVREDNTLVFDVKQGWQPLCEFLSLDVPEEPFPHENKRGEIAQKEVALQRPAIVALVEKFQREQREGKKVVFAIATVVLVLLLAIFVSFKMW